MINVIRIKKATLIISCFILTILLFHSALSSYFSQDDFFHLRTIMDKNFNNIPSFFVTWQEEQTFYRPLSREFFNLLMYKTFGLNPLPFHIFNYFLIISNTILCFFLVKKLFNDKILGIFSALLYNLNAIHSIELYYLASVQTLFVTFFLLLSIYFYISFCIDKILKKYFLSILFYILALFSHETAIVLSGILFLITIFFNKNELKSIKIFYYLTPFFLITIFYLFNTSLFNNLPSQKVYLPVFSIKSIINTLSWYILWSFGLSEIIIDFIGPKFQINPNLLKWYSDYLQIVISLLVVLVLSLIFFIYFYRKELFNSIYFLLMVVFFYIISLLPFLFFPQHKATYYISFSAIWFSIFIAIILNIAWRYQKISKFLVMLWIFLFAVISFQTDKLNKLTYWAAKRSVAAKYLIDDIKNKYPKVPKDAVFYIKNDLNYPIITKEWGSSSQQAFYILSGADAFKLLYNNSTINVYYEFILKQPIFWDQSKIITYTAKFPY